MYNTKYIEISSGLKEGDQVLLAPPFNMDEKDLGGAVFADGEAVPGATSNQVARPAQSREDFSGRAGGNGGGLNAAGGNGVAQRGSADGGGRRGGGAGSRTNLQEIIKRFDKSAGGDRSSRGGSGTGPLPR